MEWIRETVVALFAAVGIGTVLYVALRRLFLPPKRFSLPVTFVLTAEDDAGAVEDTVRELQELCREYGGSGRIVLLDTGVKEETRRLLRILQRENENILLLRENAAKALTEI